MHTQTESATKDRRYASIRKVTLVGSVVDLVLGLMKIFIGWLANSQALIADGIHSLSDLLTDFLVLYAAKHSHKEADENHPYGHGRIETLATVALGFALIVVAVGIAWDAIVRLDRAQTPLVFGSLALAVAVLSVLSKEAIYHYTIKVARQVRSDLLMANAWHSRSDAISSIVVLIGVAGAMLGHAYLDKIAAIVVGVMIAKIGFELVRSSSQELIDTALEPKEVSAIESVIKDTPGVDAVHMLRSRKSAGDAFIDVHIQVAPRVSVSEGHQISEAVQLRLIDQIDVVSDVTVHIDPENDEICSPCESLPGRDEIIRVLQQQWPDIPASSIENITLHYLSGELQLDLTLPLSFLETGDHPEAIRQKLMKEAESAQWLGDITLSFA
ncbi:MAG: cation diffusion facilitator family transporter [Gammaproteobacteria bacterium]